MRPSRIVVGEVRQAECLDLLIALNSGLPGMCTIHANSAREAVTKLCTLPAAGRRERQRVVRRADRREQRRPRRAPRRSTATAYAGCARSSRCPAGSSGDVVEIADIFATRDGRLVRADGFPPHEDRFRAHGFDLAGCCSEPGECCADERASGRAAAGRRAVLHLVVVLAAPAPAPRRGGRAARGPARATMLAQAGCRPTSRRDLLVARALTAFAFVPGLVGVAHARADDRRVLRRSWPAGPRSPLVRVRARRRRSRAAGALAGGRRQPGLGRPGRARPCPRRSRQLGGARAGRAATGVRRASPRTTARRGRFGDCLDRLKERLADPVADRIVEALRLAREVGGSDLGRLLRTLSALPARGRAHPRASWRPGRAGPSTARGWRWPRRGSCWRCWRLGPRRSRPTTARRARSSCWSAPPARWSPTG